jgi:hypothetical protein
MERICFSCKRSMLQIFSLVLFLAFGPILSQSVFGATLNLTSTWTASTEPDVKEYRLYRTDGTRTRIGSTPHPNTSYPFPVTVADGSAATLSFVLTAVDINNNESADSNLAAYSYDLTKITFSGYVRDSSGVGISGVVMGGLSNSPVTDAGGYYNTGTVSYGWSGTVTPSKSGYSFTPSSRNYSNVTSDQTGQNYTGTLLTPQTFTISGNVGVASATLSYTDGTSKTATADGSGNYSFTVSNNWSGTVTPSKSGYSFTPSSRNYSNVTSNQTGQNYTATISEVIVTPKIPIGASSGYIGTSYKFSTSGSSSSLGSSHPVEYQFDWGDGTFSSWGSPSLGSYSQSHVWTVPGTYPVKAQARCKNHPNNVSAWSNSFSISVQGRAFIQVTSPNGGENLVVGNPYTITWNSAYLNPSGTLYLFYWGDGSWHPIATLSPGASSLNWTIPRIPETVTSPRPSGFIRSTSLWIGNWVNGKWECYDKNDYTFRILFDGWLCKISGGDLGGATITLDNGVFDGYGVSLELGMFGIDGIYSIDTKGIMSGTYTIYDFANPTNVFYSGNFSGSADPRSTKLSLALSASDGTPVFSLSGARLPNEPTIPAQWAANLSGSASGSLTSLDINPYQLGNNLYSFVFEFSGSGSITGAGPVDVTGYFYLTSTTVSRRNRTNVYGIYEITGAINETGVFTGSLNLSLGTTSFTMTSLDGSNYTLVGQKATP